MNSLEKMYQKSRDTIWVVEARQPTGTWLPIACPPKRPFNETAAKKLLQSVARQIPGIKSHLRVWPYRPVIVRSGHAPEVTVSGVYVGNHRDRSVSWIDDNLENKRTVQHRRKHSPDGFSWGYDGTGPVELARCLLWDLLGYEPDAAVCQDFENLFVANLKPLTDWEIPASVIAAWLKSRPAPIYPLTPVMYRLREMLAEMGFEITPAELARIVSQSHAVAMGANCPMCGAAPKAARA